MKNVVAEKSYSFAILIVNTCKNLQEDKKEFILSRQLLRSGTAIGALIRESEHAESKIDFLHKSSIALKEANETLYWISLLKDTGYISIESFDTINNQAIELVKLLASIVKTTKNNIGRKTT